MKKFNVYYGNRTYMRVDAENSTNAAILAQAILIKAGKNKAIDSLVDDKGVEYVVDNELTTIRKD